MFKQEYQRKIYNFKKNKQRKQKYSIIKLLWIYMIQYIIKVKKNGQIKWRSSLKYMY